MTEELKPTREKPSSIDLIFHINSEGIVTPHETGHGIASEHSYLAAWVVYSDALQFEKYLSERAKQIADRLQHPEDINRLYTIKNILNLKLKSDYTDAQLVGPIAPHDAPEIMTPKSDPAITTVKLDSTRRAYETSSHAL